MTTNVLEAITALRDRPVFSTFYERVTLSNELKSLYKDMPQPKRMGKILGEFLKKVSIPLEKYDLFAGRIAVKELTDDEETDFKSFLRDGESLYRQVFFGHGHCTFDWENLICNGLNGVIAQIEGRKEGESDGEKIQYLDGMISVLEAIRAYILRYSQKADEIGSTELSQTLKNIAGGKPSTFYEALQLAWIVCFINCSFITGNPTLTLGRLDRILYPYYEADIKSGRLTKKRAKEYITDYYCKHNLNMGRGEHQVGDDSNSTTFNRILNFDAPQYLLLCGSDQNDKGVVNELTELFAECIVPEFKNPVVIVHYFKGMNREYPNLWKIISEKALKSSSMIIYNDTDVKAALRENGLPEETVNDYIHFGCNWGGLGINSHVIYMGPSAAKMCESLPPEVRNRAGYNLNELRCNSPGGLPNDFLIVMKAMVEEKATSIEQFFERFNDVFDEFIARRHKKMRVEFETRFLCPRAILLFGDCFNRHTIKSAACSASSGVRWHFDSQGLQGFATLVDCFLAVNEVCFEKKLATLSELYEATEKDFIGYEKLLALVRKAEKFGSDTEKANAYAVRLLSGMVDSILKHNKRNISDGFVLLPTIQSDTWHFKYGTKLGATPDGRRAFVPYSQNANPSAGAKTGGITAMLSALNNLPMHRLVSGALQFDVEPKAFEGENGLSSFASLLGEYLNRGGLNAQVSSVNIDELIDAQENPDEHRDLRVRVTGYSGIFVDVTKPLQDDIIARMK